MVESVIAELGSLDIAINNAGVNRNHAAEDCSEDDWDTTFTLNTKATFLCCQAEGRHMLKQGTSDRLCTVLLSWRMLCFLEWIPCGQTGTVANWYCCKLVLYDSCNAVRHQNSIFVLFALGVKAASILKPSLVGAGRGKIINTASMASLLVPHPQKQIAYNASKSAVVKMTQTLGCEWAERGVNVNCISPGIVNTKLISVGTSILDSHTLLASSIRLAMVTSNTGCGFVLGSFAYVQYCPCSSIWLDMCGSCQHYKADMVCAKVWYHPLDTCDILLPCKQLI